MKYLPTPNLRVVIDARPRNARGLIARELVLGKSVLGHTIDQAIGLEGPSATIRILAEADDHPALNHLTVDRQAGSIEIADSLPTPDTLVLRTDRLYETGRLRKAVSNGRDPETAVLWRLDDPRSIENAGDELLRRYTYQPLGQYWAFPIARTIARGLVATPVRPNALTLGSGFLMIAAAALVASVKTTWFIQGVVALAMAIALVLDTADGHLARLQGTASPFGRWLDNILDELADLALHASIAWAGFAASGRPLWLMLGMVYASGKYFFAVQSSAGEILDRSMLPDPTDGSTPGPDADAIGSNPGDVSNLLRLTIRGIGHADFRWHLWILLALLGRLDIALIVYAAYFPIRTGITCVQRGVRHAIS